MTELVHVATLGSAAGGTVATVTGLQIAQIDEETLLYAASPASGLVSVFAIPTAGRAIGLSQQPLGGTDPLSDPLPDPLSGTPTVLLDSGPHAVSLSLADNALVLTRQDGSGAQTRLGAQDGLGLLTPTQLELVTLWGKTYAVVGAAGSSSLSVIEITPEGGLRPTDHVIDDLGTRFSGVTAMTSVMVGERAFVLAAGADDGLTLLELLPDGRLVLRDVVADGAALSLETPVALAASAEGQVVQVFAGSEREAGVTQFSVSPGAPGQSLIAVESGSVLAGSGGDDILVGGAGPDDLSGGAGRDTLVDGAGSDSLSGGAGRDLFVLSADGDEDHIFDFDPDQDALDLSGWFMLRSPAQLAITSLPGGARIEYGDERLVLHSADGAPITVQSLLALDLLPLSHVPFMPAVLPVSFAGTNAGDLLEGNLLANEMSGGGGNDILRGVGGDDSLFGGVGADWLEGGGDDDLLRGDAGHDTMMGDDGRDTLYGNAGNDRLHGGGGDDTLSGGIGADVLTGDGGADRLIGAGGPDEIDGGDGADLLLGGEGGDLLRGGAGADRLEGGIGFDTLEGGAGDDVLIGAGGFDLAHGGDGDDTIEGNDGNDTLYGEAGRDVIFGGQGADRLHGGTEDDHLEGGRGPDQLWGGAGADVLRGNAGGDILDGGAGDDLLHGGIGADMFVFSPGHDRIADFSLAADLLRIETALAADAGSLLAAHGAVTPEGVLIDLGDAGAVLLAGVDDLGALAARIELISP